MNSIPGPGGPAAVRRSLVWYGFTIFLSSAILLVLEIVAARLIAPYVGVSLYSWTSIIGVILAGLSIGNWLGGRWADRGGNETGVGVVLLLAAIFSIASLFFLMLIAPWLQQSQLDLISASFLYVLSMFFVPAVLLGVPTPLLTTLALARDSRTGHIVGRFHALAALGSILGTFVTGYWLVQTFGTRAVVIGSAMILTLLAMPFLRGLKLRYAAALLVLAVVTLTLTYLRSGFANPCRWESNYFCLRVVNASDSSYGIARALVLDHLMHGINHRDNPALLIAPYMHAMDEITRTHFSDRKAMDLGFFYAGGGSYTQPRAVKAKHPQARITVAELDPLVTRAAVEDLFVDTKGMQIIHRDARSVLQKSREQFDVIVTDVFHDVSVPYHLITKEFARSVRDKLTNNGLYLINIVDMHPDPRLAKSVIKTLQTEFQFVDVWLEAIPSQRQRVTYVISAQNKHALPESIVSTAGFERRWLRATDQVANLGTPAVNLPLLTDDFVPVERLLSELLFSSENL